MVLKKIFKYPVKITDASTIVLPAEAKILSVMEQDGGIVLYAAVNSDADKHKTKDVVIRIRGTGNVIDFNLDDFKFLGTVSTHAGRLMWHIFYQEFISSIRG